MLTVFLTTISVYRDSLCAISVQLARSTAFGPALQFYCLSRPQKVKIKTAQAKPSQAKTTEKVS